MQRGGDAGAGYGAGGCGCSPCWGSHVGRKQKSTFAGDSSLLEGQSILPQQEYSSTSPQRGVPRLKLQPRALRQTPPAPGRQLLGMHPAAHGVQDWSPHSSRQDFHSLERMTCFINPAVTKTKGLFLCNHLSVVSVLTLQHLLRVFLSFLLCNNYPSSET